MCRNQSPSHCCQGPTTAYKGEDIAIRSSCQFSSWYDTGEIDTAIHPAKPKTTRATTTSPSARFSLTPN